MGESMRKSYTWLLVLCLVFAIAIPGCSSAGAEKAPASTSVPIQATAPAPAVEQIPAAEEATVVAPVAAPAPVVKPAPAPAPKPAPKPVAKAPISRTVYITRTGEKYHRLGCQYLRRSCIKSNLAEARSMGLTACSVCNP